MPADPKPARTTRSSLQAYQSPRSRSLEPGVIAVTGGIGSGKSTVAALLAEHGAYGVDADQLAREVVAAGSSGLAAIVAAFGAEVLDSQGELDRGKMAAIVFSDSEALAELESITHPRVEQRARELFAVAPGGALLVYDVPLVTLDSGYAAIVVVDASDDTRIARLVARGLEREDALRRMAVQDSRADRLAIADYVVPNDGSLDELRAEVDQLWGLLTEQAR